MYNSDDDGTIMRYLHACINDAHISCDKSNFVTVYLIQQQNLYTMEMLESCLLVYTYESRISSVGLQSL